MGMLLPIINYKSITATILEVFLIYLSQSYVSWLRWRMCLILLAAADGLAFKIAFIIHWAQIKLDHTSQTLTGGLHQFNCRRVGHHLLTRHMQGHAPHYPHTCKSRLSCKTIIINIIFWIYCPAKTWQIHNGQILTWINGLCPDQIHGWKW